MVMPPQKHVVDDLLAIPYNNVSTQFITLVKGKLNPDYTASNTDVRAGSKVTKLTLQVDVCPLFPTDSTNAVQYDWYIAYNIANAQTLPAPNAVGGSDVLSQIFHQDGSYIQMLNSGTGVWQKGDVYRLSLAIPTSWQTINRDDQIVFGIIKSSMNNTSNALEVKLKCIYKEIYP